jgi:hypothetical protein
VCFNKWFESAKKFEMERNNANIVAKQNSGIFSFPWNHLEKEFHNFFVSRNRRNSDDMVVRIGKPSTVSLILGCGVFYKLRCT